MYKKLVVGALFLTVSLAGVASPNSRVIEWTQLFYVDAQLDQNYLNGIASFIYYMAEKQPSEQIFNREFAKIKKSFRTAPNYFQQSIVRLFSNCFSEACRTKAAAVEPDQAIWLASLKDYYHSVYPHLDASHKTINYGAKKGLLLPEGL